MQSSLELSKKSHSYQRVTLLKYISEKLINKKLYYSNDTKYIDMTCTEHYGKSLLQKVYNITPERGGLHYYFIISSNATPSNKYVNVGQP